MTQDKNTEGKDSTIVGATKENFGYKNHETTELSIKDYFGNEESWIKKYISPVMRTKEYGLITDEVGERGHTNIYATQFFNENFCKEIIEAADANGDWTYKRHEFYPTTDMLVETLGMGKIYEALLNEYIYPWFIGFWDLEGKVWQNLVAESFIIKYVPDQQAHLSFHHDHSLVTSLVTLNDEFEGGGTFFKRQKLCVKGKVGGVSIHPGNITHKHGARPITSGLRYVIVSFINSTTVGP